MEVNNHGGLLQMKTCPGVGSLIELMNLLSRESAQARVVSVRPDSKGGLSAVAIKLIVPSETFWGVNFQLKKTCADLVQLEFDMRTREVDPSILREFRDAVDNVRRTAWAAQEWHERQARHHYPQTLLPLLAAERIRRATQLCAALNGEWAAHKVTRETAGIEEFFRAVERVHRRLLDLLGDHKE